MKTSKLLKRLVLSFQSFNLAGSSYRYFCHPYNYTWLNERAVEVPVAWREVQKELANGTPAAKILEIGNVLSHYFSTRHQVLDKYEKAKGVINQDIVSFKPNKKFKLIVSISTLEHVGYDETPRQPSKVLTAIKKIRSLLEPKGRAIITVPLAHNPHLDQFFLENKLQFSKTFYLQRVSQFNHWRQATKRIIGRVKYGRPYSNANGLVVGILD